MTEMIYPEAVHAIPDEPAPADPVPENTRFELKPTQVWYGSAPPRGKPYHSPLRGFSSATPFVETSKKKSLIQTAPLVAGAAFLHRFGSPELGRKRQSGT